MKKQLLLLIFLITIVSPIILTNAGAYNESLNGTELLTDSYVRSDGAAVYTNVSAGVINIGQDGIGRIGRGYIKWDLSDLPDDITFTNAAFRYDGSAAPVNCSITAITINPTQTALNTLYWHIGNATVYIDGNVTTFPVVGNNQEVILPANSITALQAAYDSGQTWFSLGLISNKETNNAISAIITAAGVAPTPEPTLYVEYNYPYQYTFSDTYYENGTLSVPSVNVTASGPGFVTPFNVSGGYTYGVSIEPILFYWGIDASTTRRIYTRGVSENYTVTVPDQTFDTFVFTVKDFTGKLNLGTGYLEAYRVINTTETLIERQIIDVHNEVPLNLVIGATYTIRVRFSDGSTYNWGTFVPGASTTFTIVLRGVEFSDQSYQASNFIFVEVNRPTPTSFTVDYLATKNQTIWSNVTIQIRGGAIVAQISRTNNSYVYTYAGALANTSYVVAVNGDHTLLINWGYTKVFDATETYPDIPDLEAIFPMGNFDATNLIGWVLTIISGLTFSLIYRRAALLSMASMASFMTIFGFSDWSWNLIALVWFFAIIVFLTTGDRT